MALIKADNARSERPHDQRVVPLSASAKSSAEAAPNEHPKLDWARLPGRRRKGRKLGPGIYLSNDGRYCLHFYGINLVGERKQQTRVFPPDAQPEDIERYAAKWVRARAIARLVRAHLRREERAESEEVPSFSRATWAAQQTSQAARALMAATWSVVTKGSGIYKSEYGWMAVWRETNQLTGKRTNRRKTWRTKVPPGKYEAPPSYVTCYREARVREGRAQLTPRRRSELPKKAGTVKSAKWVTTEWGSGIYKSEYGWQAVWRDWHPRTGEPAKRKKSWKTEMPPGDSDAPPEYVTRYREEHVRDARARKQATLRRRAARVIHIVPQAPHVPSFHLQLKRALKKAGLSVRGAAEFLDLSKATIERLSNGTQFPRPKQLREIEEKLRLKKSLGPDFAFVV